MAPGGRDGQERRSAFVRMQTASVPTMLERADGGGTAPLTVPIAPPGHPAQPVRPSVRGKFLYAGDRKLLVRGVTYGTFRPDRHGSPFPAPDAVRRDLAAMAASGLNAVRTYTVPPVWLLDLAAELDLRVL